MAAPRLNAVPSQRAANSSAPDIDDRFLALLAGYRPSGGLLRGEELVDCAHLARRIVSRDVISFEWGGGYWLPAFQFAERDIISVRPQVARVLAELVGAFDDWSTAEWFVTPNVSLGDRVPMALLTSDPTAVSSAARVDRFIARG